MRYLRLFENMNTDGCEKITLIEYWGFSSKSNFTNKHDRPQRHPVDMKYNSDLERLGFTNVKDNNNVIYATKKIAYMGNPLHTNTIVIDILRFDDDWYIINTYKPKGNEAYRQKYKCDQWYGLLNCLKKEFNLS